MNEKEINLKIHALKQVRNVYSSNLAVLKGEKYSGVEELKNELHALNMLSGLCYFSMCNKRLSHFEVVECVSDFKKRNSLEEDFLFPIPVRSVSVAEAFALMYARVIWLDREISYYKSLLDDKPSLFEKLLSFFKKQLNK